MIKRIKWTLLTSLTILFYASAQNVIPPNRITNWDKAGYNGDTTIFYQKVWLVNHLPDSQGVMDNSLVLQNLLDNQTNPTEYIFPKGRFRFESTLQLPSFTRLSGSGSNTTLLQFNLVQAAHCISSEGFGFTGSPVPLQGSVHQGSSFILIDSATTSYNTGEWIYLYDDDQALVHDAWAEGSTGQLLTVSRQKADTLFVLEHIRRSFSPQSNPRLSKMDMNREVHLSCLGIERLDQQQSQKSNIYFKFTAQASVEGIASEYCDYAHFESRFSKNISVLQSYFHKGISYGGGGKAYGTLLHLATSDCLIEGNNFDHLRHSMLLQAGANGNVIANNYSTQPHWTELFVPANSAGDLVLHGNYPYMNLMEGNVVQNIIVDDSHGASGPFNTFFRNRAELYGFIIASTSGTNSQNIVGNEITHLSALTGQYILSGTDNFESANYVKGIVLPNPVTQLNLISLYKPPSSGSTPFLLGFPATPLQNLIYAQNNRALGIFSNCQQSSSLNTPEPYSIMNSFYPNPVADVLHLSGDFDLASIWDIRGHKVFEIKGQAGSQIDIELSDLAKGVYLLKIQNDSQFTDHLLTKL